MHCRIHRPVLHLRARRVLAEEVVAFPVLHRPDRSRRESTAAVRANIEQHLLHARRAERALIRADARIRGLRWQRPIAVLAGWSEFKHVFGIRCSSCGRQYRSREPCRDVELRSKTANTRATRAGDEPKVSITLVWRDAHPRIYEILPTRGSCSRCRCMWR